MNTLAVGALHCAQGHLLWQYAALGARGALQGAQKVYIMPRSNSIPKKLISGCQLIGEKTSHQFYHLVKEMILKMSID